MLSISMKLLPSGSIKNMVLIRYSIINHTNMKYLFTVLAYLLFHTCLQAQESFLVYSLKGNVNIVEGNKTTKAKIGSLLTGSAKITLPANAAVTFICNQTGLFTLDK